jgi:4-amino-4-deoxy-L-arabinose transferase-like glycosyltransferase
VLWGGWLVATGLVFSLMQGIFHAYYTVALAPAVGALVGMGSVLLWRARRNPFAAATLAVAIGLTAWWSYHMLSWSPAFVPWLKWVVLVGGLAAALGVLAAMRLAARVAAVSAGVALGAVLAGPAAYAVQTAAQPHTGSIPSAGPAVQGGFRGGPGFPGGGGFRGRFPGAPGGGFGGVPGATTQGGTTQGGTTQGGTVPGGAAGGRRGGMGGLLDAATVSAEMKTLLEANASQYTWVAAAVGSQNASGYQLATGLPVMPVGGFNGSDPSPTLAQFQEYVRQGKIHYFIGGGGFGGGGFGGGGGVGGFGPGGQNGGGTTSAQIAQWVAENFTARTVGGVTVYDLSGTTAA